VVLVLVLVLLLLLLLLVVVLVVVLLLVVVVCALLLPLLDRGAGNGGGLIGSGFRELEREGCRRSRRLRRTAARVMRR
jgi:hypothetical protein